MDFEWDAAALALREEVREFLTAHLTPELDEHLHTTGMSHDARFARAMGERGWIAPDWAGEYGVDPLDPMAFHVLTDDMHEAEAPTYAVTTSEMVCRVIHLVGSDELKAEILPGVLRGEVTIALGMSEPEAGSDVAAVQTRARRDGDEWVIDGQKMFTTNAHVADYVFLLTRTDDEVARHRGLTTFLVPLDHPGVEIQAVYTLSGERTNITFYSDLRLDDRWRIGDVDGGWDALMLALQDEHSAAFSPHLHRLLEATEAWAAEPVMPGRVPPVVDPAVQERLARAATALEVARLLEVRTTWLEAQGEVPVVEGPMSKLFGTEALVAAAEDLTELVGPDSLRSRTDPTTLEGGRIEHALRFSLGTAIYAGTSEIQRTIIAERGCGLPR